jgi:hypothetical protein
MDLQSVLTNAVKSARRERFERSDQLTLGEIIAKCEAIKAKGYKLHDGSDPRVYFDFAHLRPTALASWRGSYDELALGFEEDGESRTLGEFIEMLKCADGETYTGYKGGEFVMSRHTPVWVANYGNSGDTAIVDVRDEEWAVILVTGKCEF